MADGREHQGKQQKLFEPSFDLVESLTGGKFAKDLGNGLSLVGHIEDNILGPRYVVCCSGIVLENLKDAEYFLMKTLCVLPWHRTIIGMSGIGKISQFGFDRLDPDEVMRFADEVVRHESAHLKAALRQGRSGSIGFEFTKTINGLYNFRHGVSRLEKIDQSDPLTLGEHIKMLEAPQDSYGLSLGDRDREELAIVHKLLQSFPPETPVDNIRDEYLRLKESARLLPKQEPKTVIPDISRLRKLMRIKN